MQRRSKTWRPCKIHPPKTGTVSITFSTNTARTLGTSRLTGHFYVGSGQHPTKSCQRSQMAQRNDLQFKHQQRLKTRKVCCVVSWNGEGQTISTSEKGSSVYVSKVVDNVLSKSSPFDNVGRLDCFDLNLSAFQKCHIEDLLSIVIHIDNKQLCTMDSYSETSIIVDKDSDGGEYI